jgi:hypothetical protein
MLPLMVRFKFREPGRRGFGLWFPVIVIWILLATVMLALLPLMLLGALFTQGRGPGWRLLLVYPLLAAVLWNLGGLIIDVNQQDEGKVLLIDFI